MASPGKHTEIYVARGEETLGPYNLEEAAALVRSGVLSAHDLAAREGDVNWVALSTMLPSVEGSAAVNQTVPPPPGGRRWLSADLAAGLLVLLVVGAALMLRGRHPIAPVERSVVTPGPTLIPPVATLRPAPVIKPLVTPLAVTVKPSPSAPPAVETPGQESTAAAVASQGTASPSMDVAVVPPAETAPPSPAQRACHLGGTVSLKSSGGESTRFPDVRVTAYALDALQPSLDRRNVQTRRELDHLEPQLQAAAAEKAAREKAAESTLQASLQSPVKDPLHSALGFAARQARTDLSAAATDYQYLLGQRAETLDGESYYRSLPAPVAEAQTDAAGEYRLALPAGGQYAVAACVRRTGITGTHAHYWLVKAEVPDGGARSLPLSEENVASSDSEQSLLHTAN